MSKALLVCMTLLSLVGLTVLGGQVARADDTPEVTLKTPQELLKFLRSGSGQATLQVKRGLLTLTLKGDTVRGHWAGDDPAADIIDSVAAQRYNVLTFLIEDDRIASVESQSAYADFLGSDRSVAGLRFSQGGPVRLFIEKDGDGLWAYTFMTARQIDAEKTPELWNAMNLYYQCVNNLKNLGSALEAYTASNGGHYPEKMAELGTPIPPCPAAGTVTYTYQVTRNPDNYTLICSGHHHPEYPPDHPVYNAQNGLVDPYNNPFSQSPMP